VARWFLNTLFFSLFTISFAFGGVNGNDPACETGETLISISDYSLGSAIAQLKASKNVTGILTVENAKGGAAHKFARKF
jgi:hypothetical protein